MGGDGGVVATNRRYLRGAGSADKVGNYSGGSAGSSDPADQQRNQEQETYEILTTCALTHHRFQKQDRIVACRYGRLYLKESALQALLERKTQKKSKSSSSQNALDHVSKLSELYDVRGQLDADSTMGAWICPVTSKALRGKVPPAILLVPGHPEQTNLVSAFASQQFPPHEFEREYGPIDLQIKLAPNPEELAKIQETLKEERVVKQEKKKKNREKRKHSDDKEPGEQNTETSPSASKKAKPGLNMEIQARVDAALQSNPNLSSLYVKKKK